MDASGIGNVESALVTGGAGFIGSNLSTTLADSGISTVVLDNLSEFTGANRKNLEFSTSDIELIEDDVRNEGVVKDIVDRVDIVFHLAALLSRPRSLEHPRENLDVNCNGTLTVLEAIRNQSPETQFVFAGSQAEFGTPDQLPLTEEVKDRPIDIYGVNKLAAEHHCRVYRDVHGLDTTTLRFTNVYGPRADFQASNYGVIPKFVRLAMEDEELTVFEPGDMKRDPIYVDDVVNALLAVMTTPPLERPHPSYIIGSGDPITVRDIASTIVNTAGSGKVDITPWPDDWDSIRVGDLYADPMRAGHDLDWHPSVTFENGIEDTIDFYRAHWDEYSS